MNKWSSLIAILAVSCIEPYPAPDVGTGVSILVVDGFINGTDSIATVRLTRAVPLAAQGGYPAEKGAVVTIRSENGDSFLLLEGDSGRYAAYDLPVDLSLKYQLNIRTSDNHEIVSAYVPVTKTPPIDSVTWRPEDKGVTILVNTHDDSDASRYYLWDYVETWEYHAPLPSRYRNRNNTVILLPADETPYYCYRTLPSTKILVGSTVRLNNDVVRDFPLTYMDAGSTRLSVMYSVLVRQRVIDKIEFEYLQDLQRVTESVGGLFDSQPYEILGNVRSTNPSIPVLGFFSAGMIDQQRFYLRFGDLPKHLQIWPYGFCPQDTVCSVRRADLKCSIDLASLPENSYLVADLSPTFPGYTITSPDCADCRLQGGVLTKPEFWP